jgi:soluble cytochrome b562
MADLREKVVQDRGIIAQIQRYIPGFSGYRAKDDLRAADNMLRIQLADRLAAVREDVEASRAAMVDNGQIEGLDRVGALINKLKSVEGEMRHAAQGYSGISAKTRTGEPELNKLYEYDLGLATSIAAMGAEAEKLKAMAPNSPDKKDGLAKLGTALNEVEATFRKRMMVVTGTEV